MSNHYKPFHKHNKNNNDRMNKTGDNHRVKAFVKSNQWTSRSQSKTTCKT